MAVNTSEKKTVGSDGNVTLQTPFLAMILALGVSLLVIIIYTSGLFKYAYTLFVVYMIYTSIERQTEPMEVKKQENPGLVRKDLGIDENHIIFGVDKIGGIKKVDDVDVDSVELLIAEPDNAKETDDDELCWVIFREREGKITEHIIVRSFILGRIMIYSWGENDGLIEGRVR